MKSKTIILSSQTEKGRGILTLFQENDLLQCRIRLYNIESLNRFCKIAIYHQEQVYSANMLEKSGVYTSSLVGDFDIAQDFYTAIVDTKNNNNVVLSGGTYAGFYFNDNSVFDSEFENTPKEEFDSFGNRINYDENTHIHTHLKTISQNDCLSETKINSSLTSNALDETECEKCKTCKYKEFFYSQTHDVNMESDMDFCCNPNFINKYQKNESCESEQDEITSHHYNASFDNNVLKTNHIEEVKNEKSLTDMDNILSKTNQLEESKEENSDVKQKTVVESLIPQFKYVFENYPIDETLNNLIPNSKFVKINENNNQYSIGAIYDQDEMKYICYAVMCNYNSPAPQELGKHYQWLPLDKEDPLSEGYYIVFQDTQDLKIVEL